MWVKNKSLLLEALANLHINLHISSNRNGISGAISLFFWNKILPTMVISSMKLGVYSRYHLDKRGSRF